MPQPPKKPIVAPSPSRTRTAPSAPSGRPGTISSFVVHSHLRWDFVWQRPQQLLSRMCETAPVLFVEEAIVLDDLAASHLVVTEPQPGIHRVVPHLVSRAGATQDSRDVATLSLLRELVGSDGALGDLFATPVQWFYTPMPVPTMLGAFNELAVVYDCMDELAQFRFAPPDLVERERTLLANADVVFTGGRRLYEAKRKHHENVHFFGCGVDEKHYSRARDAVTVVPPEIAALRGPVLGYVGVIDERLDYDLIAHLATEWPEASIAMVGPVVKVDPATLPQGPNVHWFGQRQYDQLPSIVRGFDVCLMPFALNEATEFINPTKTLEYLASGRPVVSTPVPDVRANFAPYVAIGGTPETFLTLVRDAVERPDPLHRARGIEHARQNGWEQIVATMVDLIEDAARTRVATPLRQRATARPARDERETRTGTAAS
jgi:glycosyltransferase involved in cell wall biosynthesis